jgi:hypothetical protein
MDYPKSTARVPPDSLPDTPYFSFVPSGGVNVHMPSVQEIQQAPIQSQIDALNPQVMNAALDDTSDSKYNEMNNALQGLLAQTIRGRERIRDDAASSASGVDAKTIAAAIMRRQQLGRNE